MLRDTEVFLQYKASGRISVEYAELKQGISKTVSLPNDRNRNIVHALEIQLQDDKCSKVIEFLKSPKIATRFQ